MTAHSDNPEEKTMETEFRYPVVTCYSDDDPEDTDVTYEKGTIRTINIKDDPYEMTVDTADHSYHLIFGHQINGNFLCIPNWQFGCELSYRLSDVDWNFESMRKRYSEITFEETTAIVTAIALIAKVIGSQ